MVAILSVEERQPLAEPISLAELPARLRRLASSGESVLLVGRGVWRLWDELVEWLESNGFNHLLLEMLDPREAQLARVPYERLLGARIMLVTQEQRRTAPVVDRRGSRVHIDAVLVARPEMCRSLGCPKCTCPSGALELLQGAPPRVKPSLCTGCGVCLSTCPHRALWKHSASPDRLWDYLRYTVTKPVRGFVVYACRGHIAGLVDELSSMNVEHPVLVVPVTCPGDATLELLVASHLLGLRPVIHCPGAGSCGESNMREYIGLVLASYSKIAGEPIVLREARELLDVEPGEPLLGEKEEIPVDIGYAARLASARLIGRGEPPRLPIPLSAHHIVRHELCDICAACVVKCPHQALSVETRGDKMLLLLDPLKCVGCGACQEACPNKALVVEPSAPNTTGRRVLHEEEVVKCIACGKPIGSRRMIERVVRELKARGFKGYVAKMVYLCEECKRKATLGIIKLEELRMPEEE